MANIMINKVCNLRCPYCFANEFVNDPEQISAKNNKGNITIENYRKAVEFVLRTDTDIRLIGGEPLLHPNFRDMIEMYINDNRVNRIHIFTNGVFIDKYFDLLVNDKITMMINLNSPNDIGRRNYKKILKNLDELFLQGKRLNDVTLGINMYKENFEYEYIIEALERYNYDHVRTSICVPNSRDKKYENSLDYFRKMKNSVFEFFRVLEKEEIMPTYDCNTMPMCVMTYDEKEWLSSFFRLEEKAQVYCNIVDGNMCGPVIDILPDLTAVRCFGLSEEEKASIEEFENLTELGTYFYNLFDAFAFNIYNDEICKICSHRKKANCMGGCLAFKIDKINNVRKYANEIYKTNIMNQHINNECSENNEKYNQNLDEFYEEFINNEKNILDNILYNIFQQKPYKYELIYKHKFQPKLIYKISLLDNIYILKIFGKKHTYSNEVKILRIIKNTSIKHSKIIKNGMFKKYNYILKNYVEGESYQESIYKYEKHIGKLVTEIAQEVARINGIEVISGLNTYIKEMIKKDILDEPEMFNILNILTENKTINISQREKILNKYNSIRNLDGNNIKTCYNYADFGGGNFIIGEKDGIVNLNGLIDFEHTTISLLGKDIVNLKTLCGNSYTNYLKDYLIKYNQIKKLREDDIFQIICLYLKSSQEYDQKENEEQISKTVKLLLEFIH